MAQISIRVGDDVKKMAEEAWEDFEYWMKPDKKTLKRILQLLKVESSD